MSVEQHLERLEVALDKLSAKMDTILSQSAELKTEVAVLQDRDRTRIRSISSLGERTGALEQRIPESFLKEYQDMKKKVDKMYFWMAASGGAAAAVGGSVGAFFGG